MKRYISISIMVAMFFSILSIYTYADYMDTDYIDVKIGKRINRYEKLTLSSENGFYLYDRDDIGREIFRISENTIVISVNDEFELNLLDSYNDILETIPGDGSILIGSGDRFDSIVKVEKNRYRDYITFLVKGGNFDIINHVDLEHYLYGVVPREIPASSAMDALKAQSVVARSYAVKNINKHIKDGYNLCDTTHCQVYGGYDNEHPSTNQAVIETYGEYVTYNGNIVETPYHSTSGGVTESSVNAWGGAAPYLTSVEDNFSNNSPNSLWSVEISQRDIKDKLISAGIDVGEILRIELIGLTEANRVIDLKVLGSSGEQIISGVKLQGVLGLKSRWFTVDKEGGSTNTKVYVLDGNSIYAKAIDIGQIYIVDGKDYGKVNRSTVNRAISSDRTSTIGSTYSTAPSKFVFNGRGYGHGVGMSQYGAMEMAKQGYNYYDIITHYYSGAKVINIRK